MKCTTGKTTQNIKLRLWSKGIYRFSTHNLTHRNELFHKKLIQPKNMQNECKSFELKCRQSMTRKVKARRIRREMLMEV